MFYTYSFHWILNIFACYNFPIYFSGLKTSSFGDKILRTNNKVGAPGKWFGNSLEWDYFFKDFDGILVCHPADEFDDAFFPAFRIMDVENVFRLVTEGALFFIIVVFYSINDCTCFICTIVSLRHFWWKNCTIIKFSDKFISFLMFTKINFWFTIYGIGWW